MLPTSGLSSAAGRAQIRRALPRLDLRLYEYQTRRCSRSCARGEIDLGILALPVDLEGLEARELYEETSLSRCRRIIRSRSAGACACGPPGRNPAAARGRPLSARPGAGGLQSRGRAERQDFRATSLETLRQMVATGAGITLLPELATPGRLRQRPWRRGVPFVRPAPVRQIGAVWRKTSAPAAGDRSAVQADHRAGGLGAPLSA